MRVSGPPIDRERVEWIADLPARFAAETPDKPAIIFDSRATCFQALEEGSRRLAAGWQAAGLEAGATIGYFGRNSELFYQTLFACARGGYVLASFNWRYAAAELAYVLEDARPALLIHDPDFAGLVAQALDGRPSRPILLPTVAAGGPSLATALHGPSGPLVEAPRRYEDPLLLIYTSGTTGRPKGVLFKHGAVSAFQSAYDASPQWDDWRRDDVGLSAMPNFHMAGIGFMMMGLAVGATMVHTADPSPANLIALCNRHAVTRIFMVPTVIRMVLDDIRRTGAQAPKLTGLYYGASPVGSALLKEGMATFGCGFTQFYGMTEACSTHVLGPAEHDPARPQLMRSVGRPLAGVACEIRRADGGVCPPGEHGEIWIRSDMLMAGYANRPRDTAEAIIDGWFRTGDGGYVDEEGYLYLTDRLKDMIITGGENVYPIEVEDVIIDHPQVAAVAVVGIPDPVWGERVTAVVEPAADGTAPELDQLRDFARGRLAGYKCPRALVVVDTLPRTASGKIQRGVVRSMLETMRTNA
ncbi:AMP-binding protein [Tistrella mobilis]|uniref:3-methylmercaptopropionyl-CoA ligase n=1 Tax=Tistrella mobilis (strain KA081020-065) TaxID=1110502 RepID=I3TT24_TISMK|nr:AMP-binding protein [Tistrella mobilis]AFK55912.1 long-chain-fatty-acid--CoA ligase [Tistrella mobilis KA081020-065]